MHIKLRLLSGLLVVLASFPLLAQSATMADNLAEHITASAGDERCIRNLRDIFTLLGMWVHQSGGVVAFPSNLRVVYPMSKKPDMFICPADKRIESSTESFRTSYRIVNDPFKAKLSKIPPSRIAVVIEKMPNHGGRRFVLYWDGSVRSLNETQFNKLRNNLFVDVGSRRAD